MRALSRNSWCLFLESSGWPSAIWPPCPQPMPPAGSLMLCRHWISATGSPNRVLTVNGIYNYTPMRDLKRHVRDHPGVDQANRQMILDHHQEARTITQQATLDLNYGISERFGLQVTVPYLWRTHQHIDGIGEDGLNGEGAATRFSTNGIGDIRVGLKYNVLPTLRSMVVLGWRVCADRCHGAHDNAGTRMESPAQLGRGQVGINPTIYQSYELIPHRLNQFFQPAIGIRFGIMTAYQFGDEYI